MMTTKFFSGSASSVMSSSGLPSTSSRSASAPSCDDAEFSFVRVALAGEGEQVGVGAGGHREDFGRFVPAGQRGEERALALGEFLREEDVGAEGGFDFVFAGQLIGAVGAGDHFEGLGAFLRAGREEVGEFGREGLGAEPDAALGDQLGGRFVHEVAVLDAADAGVDGPRMEVGV